MELRGGYYWVAMLQDGSVLEQGFGDGQERSVEYLRTLEQPIAMIHMVPLRPPFPYIILEVGEDEDWYKMWAHSEVSGVDSEGRGFAYAHETDWIALGPRAGGGEIGTVAAKPVRLFVLPGPPLTLRMTTFFQEEGYYAEKPPDYQGPYPHLEDRRYALKTIQAQTNIVPNGLEGTPRKET